MYTSLLKQKLFFFALDALLILAAFVSAFYLRLGSFSRPDFPFQPYIENAFLVLPIWLFLLVWGGKYALNTKNWGELLRITSLSGLAGAMLFVLIFFFRREIFFSRKIVVYIFFLGSLFVLFCSFIESWFEQWKVRRKKDTVNVLIIGVNRAAQEIVAQLKATQSRLQPVAILAPYGSSKKEIFGIPVLGKLDALEQVVEQKKIQHIILCDGTEQMMNLLSFAEGKFLGFQISPEILGVFRENIFPEFIAGKTLLSLQPSPLFGWGQLWKRGFDVTISVVTMLMLAPVFLIQKIFYRKNQLFHKECRIGSEGKEFEMFRYARVKNLYLRDIPNIFNIFKGDMSVVGPRPALPSEWTSLPFHFKRRLVVRPGMLGLWQLKKLQGSADDSMEMCKDDMKYIQGWSFWEDIKIIIFTIWELAKNLLERQKSKTHKIRRP